MNRPRGLMLGKAAGSARYLEGALQIGFDVDRVYGPDRLGDASSVLDRLDEYRLFVLTDYPAAHLSADEQARIASSVEHGQAGLLMVGGWTSFSALPVGYRGTRVGNLLPVECATQDDRVNTPLGTFLIARPDPHPAIATVQGQAPCCVVGYNRVTPRSEAEVLIHGYQLRIDLEREPAARSDETEDIGLPGTADGWRYPSPRAALRRLRTPILSVCQRSSGRVAAFASDLSPHWAGGIVDWGEQRVTLSTGAEVGDLFRAFVLDLCGWLAQTR